MNIDAKKDELAKLQQRLRQLEAEVRAEEPVPSWSPSGFYGAYYATTGFMLGIFGAIVSLLANVIAAPIAGKDPLELIRVYLTFPLGEKALELAQGAPNTYVIGDGIIIAFGCCLYLATGMILGAPFHVLLLRIAPNAALMTRIAVATVLATLLWVINFYGILIWLQPLLFGGNWITDSAVLPWWVAWATHIVFGWTMAVVAPLGKYHPYLRPTEIS